MTASVEKIITAKKSRIKRKITSKQKLLTAVELFMERVREDGVISPEVGKFNKIIAQHREEKKKKSKKKVEQKDVDIEEILRYAMSHITSQQK